MISSRSTSSTPSRPPRHSLREVAHVPSLDMPLISHSRPWLRVVPPLLALPGRALLLVLACLLLTTRPADAVQIPFSNCLPDSYRLYEPRLLQWTPLYADARFDTESENHNLRVIIWGNVTGSHSGVSLPPPSDSHWEDPTETEGKIVRLPNEPNAKVTALKTQVEMLTYQPFGAREDFCNDKLVNASCPLAPVFNQTDVHDFFSSYAFASFSATFLVIYGDVAATDIGCVSATITPDLGHLAGLIKWMPFAILLFVGFATVLASMYSPWGTTDVLRWTSNFGRDQDLLRLVTPGFGDCLQYIQFVVLTGSLTLSYPGFYQPIVSQASWSALMFNESFVDKSPGWPAIQDGIYVTEGHHGLERFAHLVGMGDVEDIWVGMMVWLLVIIASVLVLIQIGFFVLWIYRLISSTTEEDLRAKNLPFSIGNVVRVVFNFFLLPIVALSTFQLVVAGESANFAVALAVLTLGIAIGAGATLWHRLRLSCSPSVRVVQVLPLHAFRPFPPATFMNAYHTMFSVVRFITVMPHGFPSSLELGSHRKAPKDVRRSHPPVCLAPVARVAWPRGGLAQDLSACANCSDVQWLVATGPSRQSTLSSTRHARCPTKCPKAGYMPAGRVRSESQGSAFLLRSQQRSSSVLDSIDTYSAPPRNFDSGSNFTPTTPGEASTFSFLPSPGGATRPQPAMIADPSDPYYRPPRRRGDTLTGSIMSDRRRVSIADSRRYSQLAPQPADGGDLGRCPALRTRQSLSILLRVASAPDSSSVADSYGLRPTGPMLCSCWLRRCSAQDKEKGKGFEVVRSARMPTSMRAPGGEFSDNPPPEGIPVAMGVLRNGPIDSDDDDDDDGRAAAAPTKDQKNTPTKAAAPQDDLLTGDEGRRSSEETVSDRSRVPDAPPALPGLDYGDSFHLPSRIPSQASRQPSQRQRPRNLGVVGPESETPDIPRKSSKRHSQAEFDHSPTPSFNLVPPTSPSRGQAQRAAVDTSPNRLPFTRTESQRRRLSGSSMDASDLSQIDLSGSPDDRPTSFGYVPQHNISRIDPDQQHHVDLLGASAELVDERGASSRSSTR
ncbi:integral membrane protein [Verticillium alfalfae VaMs.102]|uniref:Integral membrane protein n=1 Tax=Verticillium alfalfae (strain VaMs.102 / ATCC MYA-4576 / FGSC 10136) TaxID=526221 RepID=C9SK07_VERA1|nr:integral membrane protein [Verticillium alfalfae VaMs.102]EEY19025.1 integral membrane protein [Verticillium alfalfae VaMs.102]